MARDEILEAVPHVVSWENSWSAVRDEGRRHVVIKMVEIIACV